MFEEVASVAEHFISPTKLGCRVFGTVLQNIWLCLDAWNKSMRGPDV